MKRNTILCDCEAIINSSPLTYLAENTTQLKALSLMMFLQDIPRNDTTDLDNIDLNLNKQMKYCKRRANYKDVSDQNI